MSKLEAALQWARRGFRVFPLQENSKDPLAGFAWTHNATTDEAVIRAFWTDPLLKCELNYNVGVLTTGIVVADVDVKKGKQGLSTFMDLGLALGETLTVETISGGLHLYYSGADAGQSPLGKDVDVRSRNGYVLAPGSEIDGKFYKLVFDVPVQPVPDAIRSRLKAPKEHAIVRDADIDLDTPEVLALAGHYLDNDAPLAIEGMNGDSTTYNVACRLRDLGVSAVTATEILAKRWNPRCTPPWDYEELKRKVENAWSYAKGTAGGAHPSNVFANVSVPTPMPLNKIEVSAFEFDNALGFNEIPARDWLIRRMLMRKYVSALIGAGAVGKSTFIIELAAFGAMGLDFLGFKTVMPFKSILVNGEEDIQEQSRRLQAVCQQFQFDYGFVKKRIAFVTVDKTQFMLTTGNPPTINNAHVAPIIQAAADPDVGLAGIDPLIEVHSAKEDDNVAMRYVLGSARLIGREANVAVLLGHHTSKPRGAAEDRTGDVNSGRGATSIINAARFGFTLFTASEADVGRFHIPDDKRHEYVRLDDGKLNFSLATGDPVWMRRTGVRLFNGDEVGVLAPVSLKEAELSATRGVATVLIAEMTGAGVGSLTLQEAAAKLMAGDPMYGKLSVTAARSRIERLIKETGVNIDGTTIKIVRSMEGSRPVVRVTLG